MAIENDIFQPNFKTSHQKALINILYTNSWLTERLKKILDKGNITMQQFNILRILRGAGEPISTLEIRKRMLDKMSDTSRIVDRLVKKDLVQKNVCGKDKRLVDVVINSNGKALLAQMDTHEAEILALLNNISQKEAMQLNILLDKIRDKEADENNK